MVVTLQIAHWQFFHKGHLARSTISIRTWNKPIIRNNVKLSTVRWCWRRLKDLQNFWKNRHFNIWQRVIEWGRGYLSQPHSPPLSASSWLDTTPSQNGDYYVKVQLIIEKIFITSSLRGCEFATIITNTEW